MEDVDDDPIRERKQRFINFMKSKPILKAIKDQKLVDDAIEQVWEYEKSEESKERWRAKQKGQSDDIESILFHVAREDPAQLMTSTVQRHLATAHIDIENLINKDDLAELEDQILTLNGQIDEEDAPQAMFQQRTPYAVKIAREGPLTSIATILKLTEHGLKPSEKFEIAANLEQGATSLSPKEYNAKIQDTAKEVLKRYVDAKRRENKPQIGKTISIWDRVERISKVKKGDRRGPLSIPRGRKAKRGKKA